MPRLLGTEYVYSGAMDNCFNDYVTTSSTTIPNTATQQYEAIQLQTHQHPTTGTVPSIADTKLSNSYLANDNYNAQEITTQKFDEQQIHTISSSDEDEFVIEQSTIEEEMTNMSSDENFDFEGFDDYTNINSSDLTNDPNQEQFNISSNYLKRPSHIDLNEKSEHLKCIVESIEVKDDDKIATGEGGKIIYTSREKVIPRNSQTYKCKSNAPNKRKKHEDDKKYNANTPVELKTPPDQIVEVNSDSTTNSLKQKRQQINNKFQFSFCQQTNNKSNNNPNKCSSESSSEFPVSSPSNPQQPRGGKYPARPPLLKNTLPADSFERQLAMITACNPQMTLAEKIQSWDCREELSDVEDVNKFDEDFKRLEKQKKLEIKQKEKNGRVKNTEIKNFDLFRQMILHNIKEQKNQKFKTVVQGGSGGGGISGVKCINSSGSESSKSVVHVDDRPSTSAVAQQQLQQRRCKPQLYFEVGEPKKRARKDGPKRNQNSTTPPQTSSSENERDCFQSSKNNAGHHQVHIHDTLICPSSSEEANSQDVPTRILFKANNKCAEVALKNMCKKNSAGPHHLDAPAKSKNCKILTDEEIDSVFRLHRLNRERDKYNRSQIKEEQSHSIIQMHLDFSNENKTELLIEKKQELFKTPIIPQKYLANPLITAEFQKQNSFTSTKNVTKNEEITNGSPTANSLLIVNEVNHKVNADKVVINPTSDDLDGVYHQQHEFCNYLGLTGMSTATAMANAVAELAQCNLARRSMRVLRQQQQERRDKSAKEERLLENLKLKEIKEIRKRDKRGCDIIPAIEAERTFVIKSDEGSQSQVSELTNSVNKTSNKSMTKSSTRSQNSFKIVKKPEIKILCHIAAKNKEESKTLSSECIKQTPRPIRNTLIRQAKQRKPEKEKPTNISNEAHEYSDKFNIKKFKINKKGKAASVEAMPLIEKENVKRVLRSPLLTSGKYPLKNTRSRSQIRYKSKEIVQSGETPVLCKLESICDTGSVTKSTNTECASPFLKSDILKKDETLNDHSKVEELSIINSGAHLIPPTTNIIQQKLQMALEESRKSKPSIFIVQSLECKKDKANNVNMNYLKSPKYENSASTPPPKIIQHQEINSGLEKSKVYSAKFNKINKIKAFKTHKGKNYPISKRQLRKRKIIVIKTLKPKHKSYDSFNLFKRKLRSSPKTKETQEQSNIVKEIKNYKQKSILNKIPECNEPKCYRTVHTETKDLEIYLNQNDNPTKTRLMAKATALIERSKRMNLRDSCNVLNSKTKHSSKIQRSKFTLHGTRKQSLKSQPDNTLSERKKIKTPYKMQQMRFKKQLLQKQTTEKTYTSSSQNLSEIENVVVSSTTNTYDEKPHDPLATQSPAILTSIHNTAAYVTDSPIKTKDQLTQCSVSTSVQYLKTPPLPTQSMRNPLKSEYGAVLYIYHELEILIVIQERLISFWKSSKLINMLIAPNKLAACAHQTIQHSDTALLKPSMVDNCYNNQIGQPATSSTIIESNECGEWNQLGELRRLNFDFEISVPYANRICLHNSTPIYLEMRAQELPRNQRDCNLLSMYINIYYYNDEDMIAKCNSIPLDSIQSDKNLVNYTTLIDSRYFIITWPQENHLGKTRSGLCKYSLTPQLDTLASIREFKSMRHTIRYLECMSDDKLIGFGETQVSIWDYRSGDVLMNFDLEISMGRNLGSIYFTSQDIEQNNMLILHQFHNSHNNTPTELITIACTVTHTQPSYRVLQAINLPEPAFKVVTSAIKTGDHLVVTGQNHDELWISLTNPRLITIISNIKGSQRFYSRDKAQLIELTEKTLNVNSLANHILQLAASSTLN